MVQLGEFIFNEMLGPLSPFKILNSVDNSVELYTRDFKKDLPMNTQEVKNFLVDAVLNIVDNANKQ